MAANIASAVILGAGIALHGWFVSRVAGREVAAASQQQQQLHYITEYVTRYTSELAAAQADDVCAEEQSTTHTLATRASGYGMQSRYSDEALVVVADDSIHRNAKGVLVKRK